MKLIVLIIEHFHPICKSKLVDRVQQLKRSLVHFPRQVAGMKEKNPIGHWSAHDLAQQDEHS
jgi:hypothetical protein